MNYDQRLRELAWRRKLTDAELAQWRSAHPEGATEADTEAALSDALARLPDAPVPSNFTARVLQGLEREPMRPARPARKWPWVWHVLVPRAAVAMVVMSFGLLGYQQYRVKQRMALKDSLVTIAAVPSLPSPEILQDFDVIHVIQKLNAGIVASLQDPKVREVLRGQGLEMV